jgi:hypothetical protein
VDASEHRWTQVDNVGQYSLQVDSIGQKWTQVEGSGHNLTQNDATWHNLIQLDAIWHISTYAGMHKLLLVFQKSKTNIWHEIESHSGLET